MFDGSKLYLDWFHSAQILTVGAKRDKGLDGVGVAREPKRVCVGVCMCVRVCVCMCLLACARM